MKAQADKLWLSFHLSTEQKFFVQLVDPGPDLAEPLPAVCSQVQSLLSKDTVCFYYSKLAAQEQTTSGSSHKGSGLTNEF